MPKGVYDRVKQRGKRGSSSNAWRGGLKTRNDGYIMVHRAGHSRAGNYGYVLEHILVAEKALGRSLPPKAEVHHVDGNRANNEPGNLIICQDDAYHKLLHKRSRALSECGHAGWRKCWVCTRWDSPTNMYIGKHQSFHKICHNNYERNRTRHNAT